MQNMNEVRRQEKWRLLNVNWVVRLVRLNMYQAVRQVSAEYELGMQIGKEERMQHKPYGPYEKFIKRPQDCFLATCDFVVLSPVLGITALLVRKKLGTPVLFSQERPGKDEKSFKLYKFRTMTDEKDANGEPLPD